MADHAWPVAPVDLGERYRQGDGGVPGDEGETGRSDPDGAAVAKPSGSDGATAWLRSRHRGLASLVALSAGVLLAASVPPWGFWILAFPGAALLYLLIAGCRPRSRLWLGFLAGVGLFAPGLAWSIGFDGPGGVVLIGFEALFIAVACLLTPSRRARILAFPAALTLLEAARHSWPFGGLPLAGVSLGQAAGPFAYAARLSGSLLVGALVWLGGAVLGELVIAALAQVRRRHHEWGHHEWDPAAPAGRAKDGLVPAMIGLGVVAAIAIAGALAANGGPAFAHLRVAAVQGGGIRGLRSIQVSPVVPFNAELRETRLLFAVPPARYPQLVLWPEDVVGLSGPLTGSFQAADLATLARSLHATLLAGVTEPVGATRFKNEVVGWGPNGKIVAHYEEIHRVPFGEYVPYRSIIEHLANLSDIPRNAIPGHGSGMITTPAGRFGVTICYDVFFGHLGRRATRAGGTLLLLPANTASYTTSQVPAQQLAAARLQAIENGRDLLEAGTTGFSSVITNDGQVLSRSELVKPALLLSTVALRRGSTLYVRFGSLPVLVLAGLALLLSWLVAGVLRPGQYRRTGHTSL